MSVHDIPGREIAERLAFIQQHLGDPVGFQSSASGVDLVSYAACSYSLGRPPRTGRRWIRFCERSATGWSDRGGRCWRLRWGRRPL
jgi:hypothetical protein